MNICTALSLVLCGIFAAGGIAARLQRDRTAAVDALAFYQGCVGLPVALFGLWGLVLSVARLYQLESNPVWWVTFLGTAAFEVLLGSLLAVGLVAPELHRGRPDAAARGSAVRQRLSLVQIPLGLLAIGVGFWCYAAVFLVPRDLTAAMPIDGRHTRRHEDTKQASTESVRCRDPFDVRVVVPSCETTVDRRLRPVGHPGTSRSSTTSAGQNRRTGAVLNPRPRLTTSQVRPTRLTPDRRYHG